MKARRCGYTLIELLLVLGILGVLWGIILPVVAQVRERARITRCTSNLRQIVMALQMYVQDSDGRYPTHLAWPRFQPGVGLYPTYVTDARLLLCPSDPKQGEWPPPPWRGVSYWYPELFVDAAYEAEYSFFYGVFLNEYPLAAPIVWCEHHTGRWRAGPPAGGLPAELVERYLGGYLDGHISWWWARFEDQGVAVRGPKWPW